MSRPRDQEHSHRASGPRDAPPGLLNVARKSAKVVGETPPRSTTRPRAAVPERLPQSRNSGGTTYPRRTFPSANEPRRPDGHSVFSSKQTRRPQQPRPPPQNAPRRPEPGPSRQSLRKEASIPQSRRPKSTFAYVAPLRTMLPTKSAPLIPPFLAAFQNRNDGVDEDEMASIRRTPTSTPRKSLPSMSVQRRAVAPRKKMPAVRRVGDSPERSDDIPDANFYVGRGMRLIPGGSSDRSSSSSSSSSSSDEERGR